MRYETTCGTGAVPSLGSIGAAGPKDLSWVAEIGRREPRPFGARATACCVGAATGGGSCGASRTGRPVIRWYSRGALRLTTRLLASWPPLAWLAVCSRDDRSVFVWHGPRVEPSDDFACEAVWPGRFEDGDFDQAAVVSGSGVRVRGEEVVFVAATSMIERLHSVEHVRGPLVSNSLPCLLQAIGGRAIFGYWRYGVDLDTVAHGLNRYRRTLPMTTEPVRLTYFHNLVWTGDGLAEREKPLEPARFRDFGEYRAFLRSGIAGSAKNMASDARRSALTWLGTVSSGYDGATVTALGAEAGCRQAISFDLSRRNEPDSGEAIAQALGVEPLIVPRTSWYDRAREFDPLPEVPFFAASPNGELAPFGAARAHLEGRVLLTGFMGDGIWRPSREDTSRQITRKYASGMGFAEFRLMAGFIDCAPAFWAGRQIPDVVSISRSEEMQPWILGDHYQRPIARRILEEAGVPSGAFGRGRKQPGVGSVVTERHFLGPESLADYQVWLRRNAEALGRRRLLASAAVEVLGRGSARPGRALAAAARKGGSVADRPITRGVIRRAESIERRVGSLDRGVARRMYTFQWGVDRAMERYGPRPPVGETAGDARTKSAM